MAGEGRGVAGSGGEWQGVAAGRGELKGRGEEAISIVCVNA